jgi:hypothetical protein
MVLLIVPRTQPDYLKWRLYRMLDQRDRSQLGLLQTGPEGIQKWLFGAPDRELGCLKTIVLFKGKIEAPGSGEGSRALEQPSPRTAHAANVGGIESKIKET